MSSFLGPGGGGQQDVKLSEQEQKLVAKLLSDPTYFPVEFRTWLKNYIQDAGLTVTTSQVRGGGTGARTNLPPGLIIPCATPGALPPDALACDGVAYARAVYDSLFQMIGTTWGAGDGTTTFNVPDLRDRSLFGVGQAIGVGATDGHPFGSRSGWQHQHSAHAHDFGREGVSLTPGDTEYSILGSMSSHDVSTDPATVGPAGTNMDGPTWAGVVFAITTGKTA